MRICILYDCLFPWTIGGAERWYRNLAERLAQEGHAVVYLTLCQWEPTDTPDIPGVRVIAVGPRMPLYAAGKRRIWPPIRFGLGVFLHLLRHGRHYDRIHTASFPFFSLVAAGLFRPWAGYGITVDWHEVWSRKYWRAYMGRAGGIGAFIQAWCARIPQRAYSFSQLHLERLRALGVNGPSSLLPGEYAGGVCKPLPLQAGHIVFAGRLIPEKRVDLLVDALALAVRRSPMLHATIFGRGPELPAIEAQIRDLGLGDQIRLAGFVDEAVVDQAIRGAAVVVQPSEREGYGMVVAEASAAGVPVVVVTGEDNAATELVEDGVNGFVVAEPTPEALAGRLVDCVEQAQALRASTRAWYAANAKRLSIDTSIELLLADLD